ncbi:MAG: hypothetical protein Q6353_011600 [Candidatus Sigynarchaeum springense]
MDPTITYPADVSYPYQSTGHPVSWTITDGNIGTTSYTLYLGGNPIGSGAWTSGVPISHGIDGLAVGVYNLTIIARDGLGESMQDTVMITVTATETETSISGFPPAEMIMAMLLGSSLAAMVIARTRRMGKRD